jgi:hypothetical protein
MYRVGIEEFPLAWRWTQASHAVLPPDVLGSLAPLQGHDADRLYLRGEKIFRRHAAAPATHQVLEGPEPTRAWLKTLPIFSSAQVFVVWNRKTAISLPWQTFIAYWDDFCYPSSDDAFVFPEEGTSALAWNHYEVFEFIENAV